jgi:DNA-directed RNA polymerase subunit RPC12/RpoP
MEKKNYYCEYCGHKFPPVLSLTSATCARHPDGQNKGHHSLYQGSEKTQYTCKYCGHTFNYIMSMAGGTCPRHPKRVNKGYHSPEL